MPVTLIDDSGNEIDIDSADGGTLRNKLEEALEKNRVLEEQVATSKAQEVIGQHGYSLLKPEDLKGVPADQIEAKAQELHEQRQAQREETVRSVLADRGLEGEDLDAAVAEFFGSGDTVKGGDEGEPGFTGLESLGGQRPPQSPGLPPITDAFGNLEGHFSEKERSSRK